MPNSRAFFSYLSVVGLALAVSIGSLNAACTAPVGNTITCTGGAAASVTVSGGTPGTTTQASPYPSTLTVSGAPAGSTVSAVTVRLNSYTTLGTASGDNSSHDVGVVLEGPLKGASKPNLQIMRFLGTSTSAQSNLTVAIQDGSTAIPGGTSGGVWTTGGTFAPTVYDDSATTGEASPNYGFTIRSAAPLGTSTLASVFTGASVNGNWNLYLVDDGANASISLSSWDLIITFTAASSPSTTTLSPNPSTAYTSGANSSVTLTAAVTSGATGTVTFKDGASNLTCTGGNPATLSGATATCVTTFSTEGIHSLSANYSGDSTFITSTGNANIFAQNHASNPSTGVYCNAGNITSNGNSEGAYSNTAPYPSVIFVGDGTNTDITNSVSTVSLQLKNLTTGNSTDLHMLLVSPGGAHAYDFWSNAGSASGTSTGNYTIADGSTPLLCGSAFPPGTYGPTACSADNIPASDAFTPGPPVPAPQLPSSFSTAPPAGTNSFETAFAGATAHGAWSLYISNESGPTTTTVAGGWCIDITPATGHPTTTTVTSNPISAALGQSVTFTATVSSSPTVNNGTVTFEENGSPLVGVANNGVTNVSAGQAMGTTNMLPEGDHTITAMYHDSTNTFSDSFGTVSIRVDKATGTPTLSGSTWTYCNTGVVTIPAGTITFNDFGPAQPNPSNVFVANLPGTVSSVNVILKGLHLAQGASDLESLLVGPNGANPPTATQTLDFFSKVDNGTAFGPQDITFEDGSALSCTTVTAIFATDGPTSCGSTSYTASLFYTLPSPIHQATPAGSSTFDSVYHNTNPNGTWSLYFDQTRSDTGSGVNGGWCLNFIQNPVTGNGTTAHIGPAPSNHMRQGGTGTVTFSLLNNGDFDSNGSTGDPDQAVAHAMTVTGTLPSGLTLGTVPTTPWSCIANTMTQVTCTNLSAIAAGSSYPLLSLPVNVAGAALSTATVSGFTFSGAGMTAGTFSSDTITIDPAPVLAISKTHTGTFTQGSTATWFLQVVNNSGSASGQTNGSTVTVTDTLPAGYTLSSGIGTNWSCSGTSTVTCTTSAVVAGNGGDFPLISLTVNVPANSATSVSNTATVFGGGDLIHTNSGNGAQSTDTVTVVQVPASLVISAGQTQSTGVGTGFGTQLAVTLKDAGAAVIPSYSPVVFTAVAGGGGQSGTFDNAAGAKTVSANPSGVANAGVFTANSIAGAYTVGVTAGSATATFNLTNTSTAAATVTNVTSTTANGTYGFGAMINVTVSFSKVVNVTGTPTLALNSGGTAGYVGGSGSANLSFLYTVGAGQNSPHLDATSTGALTLNGGSIQDAGSTAAILTLPAPGAAGSLSANKNIVINTTGPTVVSYLVDFGVQSYNLVGASRTTHLPWSVAGITVVFSKPITTASAASLGGISATGFTGLGTNTLTWTFTAITNATLSTTLAGSGANAIKDAAGNGLAGGAGFTQAFSVLYGDFNGDGVVTATDLVGVNAATKLAYNLFADINGDGVVNLADVTIVKAQQGATQH